VLPAGPLPPNPQELLGRNGFGALMEGLGMRFDAILIDTPAATLGADFQAVSAVARASVLVTRRNATRTADAQAVSSQIASAGGMIIGAVLNDH
jgi:Mrp family chromosome partitioning ATPase